MLDHKRKHRVRHRKPDKRQTLFMCRMFLLFFVEVVEDSPSLSQGLLGWPSAWPGWIWWNAGRSGGLLSRRMLLRFWLTPPGEDPCCGPVTVAGMPGTGSPCPVSRSSMTMSMGRERILLISLSLSRICWNCVSPAEELEPAELFRLEPAELPRLPGRPAPPAEWAEAAGLAKISEGSPAAVDWNKE